MKWLESKRGRDLAALGLIWLLLLILLWPVTFGGKLLLPADMLMVMQPWKEHAAELGFQRVHTPFLDSIQQHYPWRKFAAEQMRQGVVPLWNPYMCCGTPFVANNQSACFYPETWLFLLMPAERAFGWAALLSLMMGGSFMYFFLRLLGLRRVAAVAGVLPFLLSGFMVGWMLLPTVRAVPMWLPLMLLAFELAVRARSESGAGGETGREASGPCRRSPVFWTALCALACGMQFLAGHLHVSVFVLLVFAAYAVFRIVQLLRARDRAAAVAGAGYAVAGVAAGTALAALQLLPVLELIGMNPRKGGTSFEAVAGNAMAPVYLLAGLMPDLFGSPVDYNFWGSTLFRGVREYVETVWYSGVATWLLLLAALVFRQRHRGQQWFWAGLWLGGAGLAWGTPLYWVLFQLLPPLRQLPGISRAVFICCFAAAVLCGMGFEALLRKLESGDGAGVRHLVDRSAVVLALVAITGGAGVWLYTGRVEDSLPGIGVYTLGQVLRCLLLIFATVAAVAVLTWAVPPGGQAPQTTRKRGLGPAASEPLPSVVPASRRRLGQALLTAVLAADLLYFAGHFLPQVPPQYLQVRSDALDRMREDQGVYRMTSLIGEKSGLDRMPPNLTMAFGFQDVQGSDSLVFQGYSDLMAVVPRDAQTNPEATSPLLDLLNCRYLLTSRDLTRTPGWRLLTSYETNLYENTEALPRAFVPAQVLQLPAAATLERMKARDFDPHRTAYLDSPEPLPAAPPAGGVSISEYTPNRVTLERTGGGGAPVVLGDTWYPGWRAFLDGRETAVLRAFYTLRAVVTPPGTKQIRFVYYPASFAAGAFVSCLAVMFITCGLVLGRRRQ